MNIIELLLSKGLTVATAESCTGGLVAGRLTSFSGASGCFEMGIVAYSNDVKKSLLGVREETLAKYGAVSRETALEMARGVRLRAGSDLGLGITGIAGPTGGSLEKPVGLVYIAIDWGNDAICDECRFEGDRDNVRALTIEKALEILKEVAKK